MHPARRGAGSTIGATLKYSVLYGREVQQEPLPPEPEME